MLARIDPGHMHGALLRGKPFLLKHLVVLREGRKHQLVVISGSPEEYPELGEKFLPVIKDREMGRVPSAK